MRSDDQKMRENKDRRTQRRMMDVNSGYGKAHSCQAISIAKSKVALLYDGVTVISYIIHMGDSKCHSKNSVLDSFHFV